MESLVAIWMNVLLASTSVSTSALIQLVVTSVSVLKDIHKSTTNALVSNGLCYFYDNHANL